MFAPEVVTVNNRDMTKTESHKWVSLLPRSAAVNAAMILRTREEVREDIVNSRSMLSVDGDVIVNSD